MNTYIDIILHLAKKADESSDYNRLQIVDGPTWREVSSVTRLVVGNEATRRWWEKTFRADTEFFREAMSDPVMRWCTYTIIELPPTMKVAAAAVSYDAMLDFLGIGGVCLSSKTKHRTSVDAIAVFSDEDATLLSAHIST